MPLCRFNPFQGIQVLSDIFTVDNRIAPVVSIPFREFKCCRSHLPYSSAMLLWHVSIPFREFKCCRRMECISPLAHGSEFQSLSGNSSVVGAELHS